MYGISYPAYSDDAVSISTVFTFNVISIMLSFSSAGTFCSFPGGKICGI
jgi:hypothetical protein